MTRRITKDDLLEIVPAIPATPYVPGYERVLRTWPAGPGPSMSGEIREYIGDWDGGAIRGRYNGDVIEAYEIVPATPAKPGVPGYTIDRGVAAWNAGGSSISLLAGDGAFEFYTNNAPGGVVCGLVTADVSTLPHEATHAIKVVGSRAYVVERGVVVHAFPTAVSAATRYFIRRTGTTVYFLSGADAYTSATPITTAKVYLDAALYLSGDYVDSPDLVEGDSGATTGEIAATLAAVVGKAGEPRSVVAGALPALTGGVYSAVSGAAAYVYGLIPPMGGLITGLTGAQGDAEGTFGAVVGVAADYDYSFVSGTFSPLTGEASWVDENDFRIASSTMSLSSDATNMQRVGDSVVSTLSMVDTINGALFISDAVYDALMLSGALYSHQSAVDAIGAMLQLGTGLVQSAETDLSAQDAAARAPTQYAVNVVTGALTTYTGYDFLRYATVDQTTFGAKADGVYRLRPGDDDGSTRPVYIDFGTLLLDSPVVKTVEAVNLAVDSDGQMFVRLVTGDSDRLYRVVHRDEISRAVASRGVGGRSWNVSLEVEDSTDFVLDMVELSVATGSRRWASRR